MDGFTLPTDLATALCERLGVPWPSGPEDLAPLYRAWCARVPNDNVSKELALAAGRLPPGDDPVEAAETYLATGLGGTCWSHVSLLAGLLGAAGARVTVALDRMRRSDGLIDFHSFAVVSDGHDRWALDPVWASGRPLPLEAGARGDHPVMYVGFDDDDGRLVHWARRSGRSCRYAVLSTVLDRSDVQAFCAVSARHSGVPPGAFFIRRSLPDATESLRAEGQDRALVLRRRDRTGTTETVFADPDEGFAALGCTPVARRRVEQAGLL